LSRSHDRPAPPSSNLRQLFFRVPQYRETLLTA
jgi:hypothetical protein